MSDSMTGPVVVFFDRDYPCVCSGDTIAKLVPGKYTVAGAADLPARLKEGCTTLLSFHGPYFPKQAWVAILEFLEAGGNLAVFGGMPFTQPVRADGTVEPEQQAYTNELHLGPFFRLPLTGSDLLFTPSNEAVFLENVDSDNRMDHMDRMDSDNRMDRMNRDNRMDSDNRKGLSLLHFPDEQPGTFWSFYPQLTQTFDHPQEMGSAGPFDTLLTPLLHVSSAHDTQPLATPAVLLDQPSGRFRGGRWLLSPWQPASEDAWLENTAAIRCMLLLVTEGMVLLEVRPTYACYRPGEAPLLLISSLAHHPQYLHVSIDTQHFELEIDGSRLPQEQRLQLPAHNSPGLHRIEICYQGLHGVRMRLQSGFWIWDEGLAKETQHMRLSAGRAYFYQDDAEAEKKPFLIFGTTYMDSRVQRKFLSLPDPARWDSDFARMHEAGVNTIRTGIWTSWRSEYMPIRGAANEAMLRAFDAFVMTACKYAIQVIFTFFAFSPPLFEGENPWLDPRSIQGQQDFILAFVRRYPSVELVSWDLINEPSFGNPQTIFSQRPIPNYDRYELKAFRQWLAERYSLEDLRLRWRQTPASLPSWDAVMPPVERDYSTRPRDNVPRHMLKVMDYTFFSQEMFARWATTMYDTIRAAGSQTLVGIGQDEAGARISPQFYGCAVDYTTTHPWWNNDDLLWDMLLDKTTTRPNLLEETGVMLALDVDSRPWHSERANAYLLERKLVTGLIARGAGVIQWLWHTNAYMKNENENSIGLVRTDGSSKPELGIFLEFGRLTRALQDQIIDTEELPDVWVVIPYSQWFLRPDLAIGGTRQAIRVLGYDFGIIPQAVSEHRLPELAQAGHQPRTIIVPGLQTLPQETMQALQTLVERGATLLVSGVISHDQHNLELAQTLIDNADEYAVPPLPVGQYEVLDDGEHQYQLPYSNDKRNYMKKAHNRLLTSEKGKGKVVWCGLPLELADDASTTRHIYQSVLHQANEQGQQDASPLLIVKRTLKEGWLILVVSERSEPSVIELEDVGKVEIAGNRAGAVIVYNDGRRDTFGGVRLKK